MDQIQRHAGHAHGGDAPASAHAHAQQAGPDKNRQQEQEQEQQPEPQPPSSWLNPTAARLLREAIVSQPYGEKPKPAAATGCSDILAFARSVDRVDSPLE